MPKRDFGIISLIFAPQITPIYFFALLLANNFIAHSWEFIVAVAFTSLVPIITLLIYVSVTKTDLHVSDRNKRHLLFYVAITSYLIGFLILTLAHATFVVTALMLSYTINTITASLINRVDKISIHVWGISGPAVALLYQYGYAAFIATLFISLLVGISRIRAKAHTPWQVASAIMVSVPLTIFIIYYLAPFLF